MHCQHERLDEGQASATEPSKTEVIWLGTSQQLDKITIGNVSLLSTVAAVVYSALSLTHMLLLSVAAATTS